MPSAASSPSRAVAATATPAEARTPASALRLGGLTPLTTIDFPGRLAAVLYCQGCPWRCGYCHNPELLDALAKEFTKSKFDVKHLLRTICNSRTYQLSSAPNEFNKHDKQNHARYYARRMIAEVLHDAIDQVTDTRTVFNKMSRTARAVGGRGAAADGAAA